MQLNKIRSQVVKFVSVEQRNKPRFGSTIFSRVAIALATVLVLTASIHEAVAQSSWRKRTPRDTVFVPADSMSPWISGKVTVPQNVNTNLYLSGTFGVFSGQNSTGFDARYCYQDPSWNAPFPLKNPPTWQTTNYQVYLEITTSKDLSDYDSIKVIEPTYQPTHQYSARYAGAGSNFEFRIYNQLNTRPDGYYYKHGATGGINIQTAQYTAGICVQKDTLAFPLTNVGASNTLIDSIASYGEDLLQVDSVWVSGPTASDFTIISQRGSSFTMPFESANKFSIVYSPSLPKPSGQDTLFIRSPNADGPDKIRKVYLSGSGAAPNGAITPSSLDFGFARVGTSTDTRQINVYNSGNAYLIIDSIPIIPYPGTPYGIFTCDLSGSAKAFPDSIAPQSGAKITLRFSPAAQQCYQATAKVYTHDGKVTAISLNGCGAEPLFYIGDTVLNFGTVFTHNPKVLYDTVRNEGNWTEHVTRVSLNGSGRSNFSFQPAIDTDGFFLNPGDSIIFAITFQPSTTTDAALSADMTFYFEDATYPKSIHLYGQEKRPRIVYKTNFLDFGKVKIGNASVLSDSVKNASGSTQIFSPNFVPSGEFRVAAPIPTVFGFPVDFLSISFQPTVHGPASSWLHISCNQQDDSIQLIGFGAIASPVFRPDSVTFAPSTINTKNYSQTVVSDTGDYPLIICDLKIVGNDASEFTFENAPKLPDTIQAGGTDSRNYGLNFTASAITGKAHHATLEIYYCDGSMDTIPLIGPEAQEFVNLLTTQLDFVSSFGVVRVGKSRTLPAVFSNTAPIPLTVANVFTSPLSAPFSANPNNITITANSLDSVMVTFTPTTRGTFNGWFNANGGDFKAESIPITGIGAIPVPVLSAKTIDLGKIALNATSKPQYIALTDSGNWPIVVRIEKQGDAYNEFTATTMSTGSIIAPSVNDSVAPDSTHLYSITFAPRVQEVPNHTARLVFYYDDSTSDVVLLEGKDFSNYLAFDVDTVNFGLVRIGTSPSPTRTVNILNTTDSIQTASKIQAPSLPFTITPGAPITVDSSSSMPIQVTFAPLTLGFNQSTIVGQGSPFKSQARNIVVLEGTGAAPDPVLSTATLDFGIVAIGRTVPRTFTLYNKGNWALTVHCAPVSGTNAPDFTESIPSDTIISAGDSATYTVQFLATTPIPPPAMRSAQITWTQDDGSTFTLNLIERDVPPLPVQIGFSHPYFGRPGDKVAVSLELQSAIPDTLGIKHISGVVTWDPKVVNMAKGGGPTAGTAVPATDTTAITSTQGSFTYDISSPTNVFTNTGTLLNFTLQFNTDLSDGAGCPLIALDTLPDTYEAIAAAGTTTIFLDSNCGTIHLLDGSNPIANFIKQNNPNPFGGDAPQTILPFDVNADNTAITIRILDVTGNEVLRPIDHQAFAQGHYMLPVSATSLSPGIYFYEFRANGEPPQVKKMAVE